MADAGHPLHGKAGGLERTADPAGAGEGAQRGAGHGQARQLSEQLRCPHFRVFRRGEAVEKPGIDLAIDVRQLLQGIADQQGQGDPALVENEALKALVHGHVVFEQGFSEGRQLRPQGQGALQVGGVQRVLFHADEMQPRTGWRAGGEQLPGAQKIQAGAETGFADHQSPLAAQLTEAPLQLVLLYEHVARLVERRLIGEIHIIELPRVRQALFVPIDLGVEGRGRGKLGHGGLGGNKTRILADRLRCVDPTQRGLQRPADNVPLILNSP
ncbi:hypothetical protein D9M71_124670 [compost metagenome]